MRHSLVRWQVPLDSSCCPGDFLQQKHPLHSSDKLVAIITLIWYHIGEVKFTFGVAKNPQVN